MDTRISRRTVLLAAGAAVLARPSVGLAKTSPPLGTMDLDGALLAAKPGVGGWRMTDSIQGAKRFDTVGLSWSKTGRAAEIEMRTLGADGGWSKWARVAPDCGHGPDKTRSVTTKVHSAPLWTGAANVFQLRFKGPRPRALEVELIYAAPTALIAGGIAKRMGRRRAATARVGGVRLPVKGVQRGVKSVTTAQSPQTQQLAGPPTIIPREHWGASLFPPRAAPSYGTVNMAFVHHTVTPNNYRPEDSAAIVLGILRFHRNSRGWNDIGYNFLVDQYGQVFEGRAGGIDKAVIGAQVPGYNSLSTGIACIGTFDLVSESPAGMDALARLIAWKLGMHQVPIIGNVNLAGRVPNSLTTHTPLQRISGHRDGSATGCPGGLLYGQLPQLRSLAATYSTGVSELKAAATATELIGDQSFTLSGSARFAGGSSHVGAPVSVQWRDYKRTWRDIAQALLGTDGSWSTPVSLPYTGPVRAVIRAGAPLRPRLETSAIPITVVPLLTAGVIQPHVKTGRSVVVRGRARYLPPGSKMTCLVERKVGMRYVKVRTLLIPVQDGRYRSKFLLKSPGLHRITVSARGVTKQTFARAVRGPEIKRKPRMR